MSWSNKCLESFQKLEYMTSRRPESMSYSTKTVIMHPKRKTKTHTTTSLRTKPQTTIVIVAWHFAAINIRSRCGAYSFLGGLWTDYAFWRFWRSTWAFNLRTIVLARLSWTKDQRTSDLLSDKQVTFHITREENILTWSWKVYQNNTFWWEFLTYCCNNLLQIN